MDPSLLVELDDLEDGVFGPGHVHPFRLENDAWYLPDEEAVVFDLAGVGVFVGETDGRTELDLVVLIPTVEHDDEGAYATIISRVLVSERVRPRRLSRISSEMLAVARDLASRRLAGLRLRTIIGWPWSPSLGTFQSINAAGTTGFGIVDGGRHHCHGYCTAGTVSLRTVRRIISDSPTIPSRPDRQQHARLLVLAEAGRAAQQASVIDALLTTDPDLTGEEIALRALARSGADA